MDLVYLCAVLTMVCGSGPATELSDREGLPGCPVNFRRYTQAKERVRGLQLISGFPAVNTLTLEPQWA